jgi:hypothetical protein
MGGGRGETDFRVGMLRAGPLDMRSSIGLGEYRGLTPGLVARGLTMGVGSCTGEVRRGCSGGSCG